VDGDVLVGMEGIHAMLEHVDCKIPHDGLSLDVEVLHHGVGLPVAQKLNEVGVNMGTEECHGARGPDG